jgi:hypothetical protein
MPREFHQIAFSQEEVVRAVGAYRRTHADFLPPGTIRRHALAGQKLKLSIEVSYAGGRQIMDFTLDAQQLAEPLIKFCAENNIAVPPADRRTLRIGDEEVMLELVALVGEHKAASAIAAQQAPAHHARA